MLSASVWLYAPFLLVCVSQPPLPLLVYHVELQVYTTVSVVSTATTCVRRSCKWGREAWGPSGVIMCPTYPNNAGKCPRPEQTPRGPVYSENEYE